MSCFWTDLKGLVQQCDDVTPPSKIVVDFVHFSVPFAIDFYGHTAFVSGEKLWCYRDGMTWQIWSEADGWETGPAASLPGGMNIVVGFSMGEFGVITGRWTNVIVVRDDFLHSNLVIPSDHSIGGGHPYAWMPSQGWGVIGSWGQLIESVDGFSTASLVSTFPVPVTGDLCAVDFQGGVIAYDDGGAGTSIQTALRKASPGGPWFSAPVVGIPVADSSGTPITSAGGFVVIYRNGHLFISEDGVTFNVSINQLEIVPIEGVSFYIDHLVHLESPACVFGCVLLAGALLGVVVGDLSAGILDAEAWSYTPIDVAISSSILVNVSGSSVIVVQRNQGDGSNAICIKVKAP